MWIIVQMFQPRYLDVLVLARPFCSQYELGNDLSAAPIEDAVNVGLNWDLFGHSHVYDVIFVENGEDATLVFTDTRFFTKLLVTLTSVLEESLTTFLEK